MCESIIDSLSLYELGGFKSEDTLLCSTNGQITQSHFETLNYLSKMSENSIIVLGFDNDKKGQNFTQKAKEALKEHKIELKKPVLKDFNDDLMAFKLLNLNKDFDKKDLELAVETKLNEPIRYFLKNHNTILTEARGKYLNKALFAKDKLMFFVHKLDSFVDDKELDKSLNLCKKMQAYEDKNLKRGR
ncbi:toprim domain-containing protein [Campylobacter troglodytis]|uniref:toprim domain-containing protein n=1 Tax=Campylobacter troglodytis TaxID=654363 RepID=UPI00249F8B1D|nr:toprim domain-containing protein [Campylobacter troglodytis]